MLDNKNKNFNFFECDITVSSQFPKLESVDEIYNLASPASPIDFTKIPLFILKTAAIALSLSVVAPITSTPAIAGGIPVIDSASLGKTILQLQQQIKDFQEQEKQLRNMVDRLTAMTGSKNISGILNTSGIKKLRLSAPSIDKILDNVISGGGIGGQSTEIASKITALKAKLDLPDLSDFDASTKPRDRATAQLAGAGLAAMGQASDTYKKADAAGQRVTALIDGIDATPDLKASVDYNTRMQGEVATLLVEMLRIQAANANATGMAQASAARDQAAAKKFGRIGEKPLFNSSN